MNKTTHRAKENIPMTVFEQHVDLSQIATEPTSLGFVLIFLVAAIIFAIGFYLCNKFIEDKFAIGIIVTFIVAGGFILVTTALTANNTATAQPITAHGLSNESDDRPILADKYREEINAGIADKLDDYTIDNVDIGNDSILTGGYLDHDVTAHRDGKNYRLHPETNFDKNTSTVTITVDIEQLAFDRDTKE